MVHVISEIRLPKSINHSVLAQFFVEDEECLVIAKLNQVEFYAIEEDPNGKIILSLRDSLNIKVSILALEKIKLVGWTREVVIIVTDTFNLLVISYDDQQFVKVENIKFDAGGQQQLLEKSPMIVVDPLNHPSYFVLHLFQGVIQLFVVQDPTASTNKRIKRGEQRLFKIKTLPIGSIVVQKLALLKQDINSLAMLYRDFNFNYSIRYYKIDTKKMILTQTKQLEEFELPQSNMVALNQGGIMVFNCLHLFYFPGPGIAHLNLSDSIDSSTVYSPEKDVVTKSISQDSNDVGVYESFNSCLVIDDSRILAITNSGKTYLIYINIEKKSNTLVKVNSFNMISLGMSTIPNSINHISRNVFFVSSRLSQSILFEILPKAPFININQFFPSSPPVLDIQFSKKNDKVSAFVCQGGYESGEFRRLQQNKLECSLLSNMNCSSGEFLSVLKNQNSLTIKVLHGEDAFTYLKVDLPTFALSVIHEVPKDIIASDFIDGQNVELGASKLEIGDKSFVYNINEGNVLQDGSIIFFTEDRELIMFRGPVFLHLIKMPLELQIASYDLVLLGSNEAMLLIAFWDGHIELQRISSVANVVIVNDKLTQSGSIFSCALSYGSDNLKEIWVHVLTSEGYFFQSCYDCETGKLIDFKKKEYCFNGLPMKITKNTENEIILFNGRCAKFSKYSPYLKFYEIFELTDLADLRDVKFLTKSAFVTILDNGDLKIYKILDKSSGISERAIYSNSLNIKSSNIPNSDYSVVLSVTLRPHHLTEELQKFSSLKLIDNLSMKEVDIFEFPHEEAWDLVDLVPFSHSEIILASSVIENGFIALCNSSNKNELALLFHVKDSKIIQLPKADVAGLSSSSALSLQSITPVYEDKLSFIVSGNICFELTLRGDSDVLEWVASPSSFKPPTISLGLSYQGSILVFGDMLKGLFGGITNEDDDFSQVSIKELDCEHEPDFLTSFDLISSKVQNKVQKLAYGDSLGNLALLEMNTEKKITKTKNIMACNIGDQINVVKAIPSFNSDKKGDSETVSEMGLTKPEAVIGTSNGAIYLLSNLNYDDDIEDILLRCQRELLSITKGAENDSIGIPLASDWRLLRRTASGEYITKGQFGLIDASLIKRWLLFDYLGTVESRNENIQYQIPKLKQKLKTCYKYKHMLQRLMLEVDGF
ncbi:uncharacterized protein PRCAT00002850001 [Priceomyces carsonii]|uniref:uncharacterized protein n=1 Tax=Priceomyces carsonii TaxID=28549 RepID=UPI002ED8E0E3|nr:unnamed protein product [Priceomyces carsonii]